MLPGSTNSRKNAIPAKPDGRSVEIQRLIGRCLRSVVNLKALGENCLWLDCDVIQADGGTRTAAITGAYVALVDAVAPRPVSKTSSPPPPNPSPARSPPSASASSTVFPSWTWIIPKT